MFQRLDILLEMFYKTEDLLALLLHCIFLSILPFDFSSSLLLTLWSIKEPGIQTLIRSLFWDASLPFSRSACSQIKVSSLPRHLASPIHWPAESRVSLDSVTSSTKELLKRCLMRVGDFRVHFNFKWKPKAKAQYCKPVSPKWISSVAAMFSSSFTSLWCFFQTVWAGEEALGAGLVAFPGAILPSRGSSFRKVKIGTSLMTQWLRLHASNTGSQGSIPG